MAKLKVKKADTKSVTISQALNELKLLDKKITKKVRNGNFIGVQVSGKARHNFEADSAKANLQSVNDLIERREMVRGKINASNQSTKIIVAGKKYTVASAIVTKDTMNYKASLLSQLQRDYSNAVSTVDMLNEEVQEGLEAQLKGIEDKSKIADFSKNYMSLRKPELADPNGLKDFIEALETEIDEFTNEVDYVLSTSNATTTIDI